MLFARRAVLLSPAFALLPVSRARADDALLVAALDGAASYFFSAAKVTAVVVAAVQAVKPQQIAKAQRAKAAADIGEFADGLASLAMVQTVMVGNIGDYIDSVRAHGFDEAAHPLMWTRLLAEMSRVSAQLSVVKDMAQKAAWLRKALTPANEQALSDALVQREALLAQLRALPAPRSPVEIDKFAALNARYGELVKQLAALRLALSEARRRFSP
ncbi:MAG: hypothetical protein AB7M12_06400 [Hyphomonadaceae bacterium]